VGKLTLKELLLADTPRGDIPIPERGGWKLRPSDEFNSPLA
jgi:hypothetical protein